MRKMVLSLFCACLSLCYLEADDQVNDRIYIRPSQLMIGQNGIFINHNDIVMSVNFIACDELGIYFTTANFESEKYEAWICPNKVCLHPNVPWNTSCSKCGEKRPNIKE